MIAKDRSIPKEIKIYEAIVRRLSVNHPRKVEFENKLFRKRAGYKGEKELDYHITQINHSKFTILHDIRIPHNDTHFQIDTLFISNSLMIPIDSKYYAGTLEFHPEFNQMIQYLNGSEKVYPDPILQTKIQARQLKAFLKSHQFFSPPLEPLVAITNSQALIKNPTQNKEVSQRVFKSPGIFYKINPYLEKYQKEIISDQEIKKVVKLLLKKNNPYIPDLKILNLPYGELQKGVECPACNTIGMEKFHSLWGCKKCGHTSKDAHVAALKDYFLINGQSITNGQFRDFLGISSVHQARRMLSQLDLNISGEKKGRVYTPGKRFPLWD
ncbi:nuclease-related domain-containing protein [Mesobacillus boroniphilus]|uniref:nuclease-related domain-containing protein n=1 Tax=Mesobacillus boroniphilus TaxID=308892 RepID=UPI001BD1380B|nr:nuclease-related domain-containing protein [Mesobacillus boroniphilus]